MSIPDFNPPPPTGVPTLGPPTLKEVSTVGKIEQLTQDAAAVLEPSRTEVSIVGLASLQRSVARWERLLEALEARVAVLESARKERK